MPNDENQRQDDQSRGSDSEMPMPDNQEGGGPLDRPPLEMRKEQRSLSDRMNARLASEMSALTPAVGVAGSKTEDDPEVIGSPGHRRSESIWQRRWRRFRGMKRGYYSFLILVFMYGISFLLPLIINNKALYVSYEGESFFPAVADLFDFLPGVSSFYTASNFGQESIYGEGGADYRALAEELDGSDNTAILPLYPWDPNENDLTIASPSSPDSRHILGTDDSGRDVLARLAYGFNVSISFALALVFVTYIVGIALGALMGYYGGRIDLVGQRVVEIWENIPFLYTVIIISAIIEPKFFLLVAILAVFQWIGISYYIRGEFLREKSRDYAAAAISLGASTPTIVFRHILPNSLTPVITFFPFALIGGISSLVALDFLGFGLPKNVPSWGEMISRGLNNLEHAWLVIPPLLILFLTLILVTFIGEAIREAFDPKVFSRLR